MNKIPPYIWVGVGGVTLASSATYFAFSDQVPLTKRRRWLATSSKFEMKLGDREYEQLLKQYAQNAKSDTGAKSRESVSRSVMQGTLLPADHRASVTTRRVGGRIAQAAQEFAKQHKLQNKYYPSHRPFTYSVIRSDSANAFVLPGNHVFVMTGLFKYVQDEDDLAAVLGHELAHIICRHAGERISSSVLTSILARLTLLLDPSGTLAVIFLPASQLLRDLPNSRTQEQEADQIGVILAAEACYDPRAAKRVFARMKSAESKTSAAVPPEFLSTHPSHESRVKQFDMYLPSAVSRYEADAGDRCRFIRESMNRARQVAARQAALKEARKAELAKV